MISQRNMYDSGLSDNMTVRDWTLNTYQGHQGQRRGTWCLLIAHWELSQGQTWASIWQRHHMGSDCLEIERERNRELT